MTEQASRAASNGDLTAEQLAALRALSESAQGPGGSMMFALVDAELDQAGIDAREVLLTLIPRFVRRQSTGPYFAPSESLTLTVRGLAAAPAGVHILSDILLAVQALASFQASFRPSTDELVPMVTLDAMAHELTRGVRPIDRASAVAERVLNILASEPFIFESVTRSDGEWSGTISRDIKRYRGVTDIDEYLALQQTDEALEPSYEEDTPVTVDQGEAPEARSVFVIHGRDHDAKDAVEQFIRALDLRPIDWESDMVARTGSGAPYTGEVVRQAFDLAHAVIVLLTPEEHFELHSDFFRADDNESDRVGWQPRPNVFFEAGMAFALHPDRTIIVEIGRTRPASDVAGRHAVRLTGAAEGLEALALRLERAGCPVRRSGGWLNGDRFRQLVERRREMPGTSSDLNASDRLDRAALDPA